MIIAINANAWLGSSWIKNDPHIRNRNGQLFNNFLLRNPHISLVNSLSLCEGSITRSRKVGDKVEKSIIDFALVCDKIFPFVSRMVIDEKKIYSLANYSSKSNGKKVIHSDHNSLIVYLNLQTKRERDEEKIIFNYQDQRSMLSFHQITSNTSAFSDCFKGIESFDMKVLKWSKKLKSSIYKSFEKIRINKKRPKKCSIFSRRKSALKSNNLEIIQVSNEEMSREQEQINLRIIK